MTTLTGAKFREQFADKQFYKVINDSGIHYGFEFKTGLNVDVVELNPTSNCEGGGLSFTETQYVPLWLGFRNCLSRICQVQVPDDAQVYVQDHKFKADKIILAEPTDLKEFLLSDKMTDEMYRQSVRINGYALRDIPIQKITKEICLEAVKQNGYAITYVPDSILSKEIYLEAAKNFGNSIEYTPKLMLTKNVCLAAIAADLNALELIPIEFLTKEICLEAVKLDFNTLELIPPQLVCQEIYLEIVQRCKIPADFKPYEEKYLEGSITTISIDYAKNLELVPMENRTSEICLEAVRLNGMTLEYIPEKIITPEICQIAANQCGSSLKFIPVEYRTNEICLAAVKNNSYAVKFIPDIVLTDEFFFKVIKANNILLKKLKKDLLISSR